MKNINVGTYLDKLKMIAGAGNKNKNYDLSLQAISASAQILHLYNQVYKDDELENMLFQISSKLVDYPEWDRENKSRKIILFYDGFGVDRRGIAIVMNNAIGLNEYKLIYISPLNTKGNQPTLEKTLAPFDVEWEYLDTDCSYTESVEQLTKILYKYQPDFSYFYTTPNDVVGVVVFDALKGKTFRCQLDLTDHAFWLGLNAFDLCSGGRQFSANIQHYFRDIPLEKMSLLDVNLLVDDCEFQGLPFEKNSRFIFSGGSLYKTLGDENNTFYRIIEHVLDAFPDIKFLYAGQGDDSQMRCLMNKYPERVFLISERPDFYQIIERCTLYLNTYPMFGGLMMRYSALAGKLPLTLKHGNDSDGILIDQNQRNIEYESFDELVQDIDKLLSDEDYLHSREKLLDGSVLTEECFVRNIRMMIEEHKTEFSYGDVVPVDTTQFRKEYLERFRYSDIAKAIASKRNTSLIKYFPGAFGYVLFIKIRKKIRSVIK